MPETPHSQPESPPPPGISLDELTEAFAEVMGPEARPRGELEAPAEEPASAEAEVAAAQPAGQPPEVESDSQAQEEVDSCEICPRTILEAMLFVGNRDNRPLSPARVAELMRGVEPREIAVLVGQLNGRYAANGCPYQIVNDGPGYQLVLGKAFHPLRNRFYGRIRQARLSQAAIDTLAIVAYQQPLTAEQVNRQRGKPSNHVLSQLVHRGLLRIERKQGKRRTADYLTTDRFLDLFGLTSLEDLPQSEELDRL